MVAQSVCVSRNDRTRHCGLRRRGWGRFGRTSAGRQGARGRVRRDLAAHDGIEWPWWRWWRWWRRWWRWRRRQRTSHHSPDRATHRATHLPGTTDPTADHAGNNGGIDGGNNDAGVRAAAEHRPRPHNRAGDHCPTLGRPHRDRSHRDRSHRDRSHRDRVEPRTLSAPQHSTPQRSGQCEHLEYGRSLRVT